MLSEGLCCSDCLGYPYDTCTMHVLLLCLIGVPGVPGCSRSGIRTNSSVGGSSPSLLDSHLLLLRSQVKILIFRQPFKHLKKLLLCESGPKRYYGRPSNLATPASSTHFSLQTPLQLQSVRDLATTRKIYSPIPVT